MPRNPDLPCADCGALMWRGTTSLPEGQAKCRPCRRSAQEAVRPPAVETYLCAGCNVQCSRPRVRGQRPKWCADCRAKSLWHITRGVCAHCQNEYEGTGETYCSHACAVKANGIALRRPKPARPKPEDQRSQLRRGYEDGNPDLFFAALRSDCAIEGSCWQWMRKPNEDYPTVRFGRKQHLLHRLVIEVKHGAALGTQAGHHACANTRCVNPDHLQPVTHRENAAEMLARQSYLRRIAELEAALAEVAPSHPALQVIAVA